MTLEVRSASRILIPAGFQKEVILHKTGGQPLGMQLALADDADRSKSAVTVKNIAPDSPADTCGNLR